jgi:hypothetical protein
LRRICPAKIITLWVARVCVGGECQLWSINRKRVIEINNPLSDVIRITFIDVIEPVRGVVENNIHKLSIIFKDWVLGWWIKLKEELIIAIETCGPIITYRDRASITSDKKAVRMI